MSGPEGGSSTEYEGVEAEVVWEDDDFLAIVARPAPETTHGFPPESPALEEHIEDVEEGRVVDEEVIEGPHRGVFMAEQIKITGGDVSEGVDYAPADSETKARMEAVLRAYRERHAAIEAGELPEPEGPPAGYWDEVM